MINDNQQTTHAIDGLSYIATLTCRFGKIERLFLRDKHSTDTTALEAEITKLYRSVLEFQAKVVYQLDRSAAYRFVRNLSEVGGWKEQIEQIKLRETTCEKFMAILDTEES